MWPLSDIFLNSRYENLRLHTESEMEVVRYAFFWPYVTEFFRILLCSSNWQFQIPCWCDHFPCDVSAIQHHLQLILKIYTQIGDPYFQWWWDVQNTPDVDIHYQYTLKYIINVCMRAGKGDILKMLYHDCKHCTYNPLPLTRELTSRIMIISRILDL